MISTCLEEDGGRDIGLDGILGCGILRFFVVFSWKDRGRLGVTEKEVSEEV